VFLIEGIDNHQQSELLMAMTVEEQHNCQAY